MSTINLDMRGKACPTPVVETKKALDSIDEGIVIVMVDNEVSKNNVERFAKKSGCTVETKTKENLFEITVVKGYTCSIAKETSDTTTSNTSYILYVKNNIMAHGDEELGNILIKAFFKTLIDNENKPATIVFVNKGVFLLIVGSPVLNELKKLSENFNIEILACGTCLDYYNLKDKVKIGTISNMFDIQNTLVNAKNIVSP